MNSQPSASVKQPPSPDQPCLAIIQIAAEGSSSPQFNPAASSTQDGDLATATKPGCTSNAAPSLRMVNAAAEVIFQSWLPHVGEADARAEADRFASRFHFLIDGPLAPLTEAEADAILADVADAMSAP